ncbi:MAG: hypothetical protein ACFFEU_10790 [Candidatus Thorarchaeota archaeon]
MVRERGNSSDSERRQATSSRVHLHTTISSGTRQLLQDLAGETGRINDVLEDAVNFYSTRREIPSCDECEAMEVSSLRRSLIDSADMGLVSSHVLSVLAQLGCSGQGASELITKLQRIGHQQTKLLRGLGTIPQEMWDNSFDSFVSNVELLERMGIFGSIEIHPERKTILATAKLMREQPEILLLMLIAEWDEAGYTVDAEVVAENKISVMWVDPLLFGTIKEDRDKRIISLWRERREVMLMQAGQSGAITLSPSLLEWLMKHTISDALDERTVVSIRDHVEQIDPHGSDTPTNIVDRVKRVALGVTSLGLLEKCDVRAENELTRVQLRSRTSFMKDLGLKLLLALLRFEGVDEFAREEGVSTAVLYFGEKPEIGRKYRLG